MGQRFQSSHTQIHRFILKASPPVSTVLLQSHLFLGRFSPDASTRLSNAPWRLTHPHPSTQAALPARRIPSAPPMAYLWGDAPQRPEGRRPPRGSPQSLPSITRARRPPTVSLSPQTPPGSCQGPTDVASNFSMCAHLVPQGVMNQPRRSTAMAEIHHCLHPPDCFRRDSLMTFGFRQRISDTSLVSSLLPPKGGCVRER